MIATVPVRDLKDTAKICATVRQAGGPVIVTRNGYPELVLVTPQEYDELSRAREKQRLYDAIAQGERDIEEGRWVPADVLLASLGDTYGL